MGLFGFGSNGSSDAHGAAGNMSVARSVKVVKDASGAPAVSLEKVSADGGVNLSKKTEAAVNSLRSNGMAGIRAQVMVVVDHSGSMYSHYTNGNVQALVDRFLGFGLAVDADGEIPVVPFDFKAKSAINVNMSNYQGIVQSKVFKSNDMGSTNLADALEKVRDEAKKTDAPLFVGIVTDGEPDNREAARDIIKDLARYPVFIKFLAVAPVRFLEELDDMPNTMRLLDNVDTKSYSNLNSVTDEQFAKDMADEWDSWVTEATAKGILTV